MCIGRPMCISSMQGLQALCTTPDGEQAAIDMSLVGEQPAGTWVLVFLGNARSVLDTGDAHRMHDALCALESVMRGETPDIEHLFADLVNREPELPPHLRDSISN